MFILIYYLMVSKIQHKPVADPGFPIEGIDLIGLTPMAVTF